MVASIPGISAITAQLIIAGVGGDMGRGPTAGHLCAWLGSRGQVMSQLANVAPQLQDMVPLVETYYGRGRSGGCTLKGNLLVSSVLSNR